MSDISARIANLSPEKRLMLERRLKERSANGDAAPPLAIVGIGCRLPGGVRNPETFWDLLVRGGDAITDVPADRWDADAFYDADPGAAGKMATRWGGFVDGLHGFDAEFFGMTPREAERLDPQQRLLLETVWEALERAGHPPASLAGRRVGVFVGIHSMSSDYYWRQAADASGIDVHTSTGAAHSIAANRLSYLLDLRGPSMAIDTACSSSLVAVHLAVQSLRAGECDMALAAGVNLVLSPEPSIAFSKLRMMAADGRCKTFDSRADGFVRGEGCGVVVLRRLDQATADEDPIVAIVRGSAVNQDGATNGLTAPNGLAQRDVVRQALRNARVEADRISFVETHGTGTALGDPIEVEALSEVLGSAGAGAPPCMLGAVKTNIGHLEAAAGIAGLIKVALCLERRYIPGNLHFQTMNPHIALGGSRLELARGGPWLPDTSGPRLAGVSSFGFGGTNAHVVLEEYLPPAEAARADEGTALPAILPLSARSPEALQASVRQMAGWLTGSPVPRVSDVAFTAGAGRSHHEWRRAVVGSSASEWQAALTAARNGPSVPVLEPWPGLVFVYSGQGPQWPGMGVDLFEADAAFRSAIERCDREFRRHAPWSLIEEIARPDGESRVAETWLAQPAVFAIQFALTELLRAWGVHPDAVVGHSAGEVAAAWASGALSFEDAALLVVHRGRLIERTAGGGTMAAIELPPEEARRVVAGYGSRLELAAFNSPTSTVISGDQALVDEVVQMLKGRGVFARHLGVNYAFHSQQMEPLAPQLLQELSGLVLNAPTVTMASSVTGLVDDRAAHDPVYWVRNMREPVRFSEAMQGLTARGHRAFLEIGPHPILASMIARCSDERLTTCGTLRKGAPGLRAMLEAVATLYEAGLSVDFERVQPRGGRTLAMPTYPWQRARHWLPDASRPSIRAGAPTGTLLGRRLDLAAPVFEQAFGASDLPWISDHVIGGRTVFPAAGYVALCTLAGEAVLGTTSAALRDVAVRQALTLAPDAPTRVQTTVATRIDGTAEVRVFSAAGAGAWIEHAHATVVPAETPAMPDAFDPSPIEARCRPVRVADYYAGLAGRGLVLGQSLRHLESLHIGPGEALARVPEAGATAGGGIDPVWIDACLQTVVAAAGDVTCLFVGLDRLMASGPPAAAWAHAIVAEDPADARLLRGSLTVQAADGRVVLAAEGIVLKVIDALAAPGEAPDVEPRAYEVLWREQPPEPSPAEPAARTPAGDAAAIMEGYAALRQEHELDTYDALVPEIEALSAAFVVRAFAELGFTAVPGESVSLTTLADRLGIVPAHRRLFGRLCGILEEEGVFRATPAGWDVVAPLPSAGDPAARCAALRRAKPACDAEIALLERCGPVLGAVLSGRSDAIQVLFPGGSFEAVERLYRDAPFSRVDNRLLQRTLERTIAARSGDAPLRILEIGAGTGGSTTYLLRALPREGVEYVFTDVSQIFLVRARQKFRDTPGLKFEILDIERHPGEQGFAGRQFDVVVAANVLHATADLRRTLGHARSLIAPGGRLILLEVTRAQRWIDLTFGLTEGWWRFADADLRPARALLTPPEWLALLGREGFGAAQAIPDNTGTTSQESVIIAQAGAVAADAASLRRWVVVPDTDGVADLVVAALRSAGDEVTIVGAPRDLAGCLDERRELAGVVYLASLRTGVDESETPDDVVDREAARAATVVDWAAVLSTIPAGRLWLVTRNASVLGDAEDGQVDPAASALWSLGRGIGAEAPERWGGLIDIGVSDSARDAAARIVAEMRGASRNEDQVAWRAGRRFVARLVGSAASEPTTDWRPEGAWLITGGLGGVGLHVAQLLARQGVRQLVLTSRGPVDSGGPDEAARRRAGVASLAALGADVTVVPVDVADERGMSDVFARFGVSLLPLGGVCHAAADLAAHPLHELDADRIASMYRAKVGGAWVLHRLTRGTPAVPLLLFSSTTALLGAAGFSHYAGANGFLDGLAHYRRARGLSTLSVNWGTWETMRLFSNAERAEIARGGMHPMPASAALRLLERALAERRTQQAIAAVDWPVLKAVYSLRRDRPFLSELGVGPAAAPVTPDPGARGDLRSELERIPAAARHDLLLDRVRRTVTEVMGYPADRPIDVRQGFFDLGMDSLMTVDLRTKLSALCGRDLPAAVTFNHPTVEMLTAYLGREVFGLGAAAPAAPSPAPAAVPGPATTPEAAAPRSLEDTLALFDAELAAIDDLVGD